MLTHSASTSCLPWRSSNSLRSRALLVRTPRNKASFRGLSCEVPGDGFSGTHVIKLVLSHCGHIPLHWESSNAVPCIQQARVAAPFVPCFSLVGSLESPLPPTDENRTCNCLRK